MPRTPNISPSILEAALTGLEARRQRVDAQIAAIRATLGGRSAGTADSKPKRRRISAEGRRRIAEAARRRWAKWKKANRQ